MNTAVKTQPHFVSVTVTEKTQPISRYEKFIQDLETLRFGVAPMLLVAMVCLGGIASAFAVQVSEIQLMTVALSTVMIELLIVAVAPMRMVFWVSVVAFLIDLFVFIF